MERVGNWLKGTMEDGGAEHQHWEFLLAKGRDQTFRALGVANNQCKVGVGRSAVTSALAFIVNSDGRSASSGKPTGRRGVWNGSGAMSGTAGPREVSTPVQFRSRTNQGCKRVPIHGIALPDVDRSSHLAVEAGVEKPRRVRERGAL